MDLAGHFFTRVFMVVFTASQRTIVDSTLSPAADFMVDSTPSRVGDLTVVFTPSRAAEVMADFTADTDKRLPAIRKPV